MSPEIPPEGTRPSEQGPAKMLTTLLIAPIVLVAWACSDATLSPDAEAGGPPPFPRTTIYDQDTTRVALSDGGCPGYNLRPSTDGPNTVDWDIPQKRVWDRRNGQWECTDILFFTHFRVQWIMAGADWSEWRTKGGSVCWPDTQYKLGSGEGFNCGKRVPKTTNQCRRVLGVIERVIKSPRGSVQRFAFDLDDAVVPARFEDLAVETRWPEEATDDFLVEFESIRDDQGKTLEIHPPRKVAKQSVSVPVASPSRHRRWPEPRPDLDCNEDPTRCLLVAHERANLVGLKLFGSEASDPSVIESTTHLGLCSRKKSIQRYAIFFFCGSQADRSWLVLAGNQ